MPVLVLRASYRKGPAAALLWHTRRRCSAPPKRACRRGCSWRRAAACSLVALPALLFVPGAAAQAFTFALIGDGPYGASAVARFDRMLDEINADPDVAFVLHAGDIKSGSESCGDALLRARFDQLQRLRMPLVYTPGRQRVG